MKRPTKDMIDAARNVFVAKASESVIRDTVEAYQIDILGSLGYDGAEMLHPYDLTYTMKNADFLEYDKQCRINRDKAGLAVEDDGFCPLLVAETETSKAESHLSDVCCKFIYNDVTTQDLICSGMDVFKEFVKLQLDYLVKFI